MKPMILAAALALTAHSVEAAEWGQIYSAVSVVTDYRYQGTSSSNREPALQGYAHLWRPDGWYAGVYASTVDYGYAQSPNYEIDLYGGRNWRFDRGRTELKSELMAHLFPDDETPGPSLDFLTAKVALRRSEGAFTYGGAVAYTPDAPYTAGRRWRAEAEAAYALTTAVKLRALAGHIWTERGQDRTWWEAGVSATWRRLTFDVTYMDTNLSPAECGFIPDLCGPAVVGKVTLALPPIG